MPYNALGLPMSYIYIKKETPSSSSSAPQGEDDDISILWRPQDPEATPMSRYRRHVNQKFFRGSNQTQLKTSHDLHRWSVTKPHDFWIDLYDYTGIIPPLPPNTTAAYDEGIKMADIPPFFPGHRLNFAENVLVTNTQQNPNVIAITGLREGAIDAPEHVTWSELWELVRMTRSALVRSGIEPHDVVAAFMSNSIWIIVVFLATASIGAYFTSISPDMGVPGCVSRLSQVTPKILFCDVDFALRGTRHSLFGKIQEIMKSLKDLRSSAPRPKTVLVPTFHAPHRHPHVHHAVPFGSTLHQFLGLASTKDDLIFTRLPPSHPLLVLYSSGTTGAPKCILSPHMSILNYKKVALLHNSLSSKSTVFQYSSTSWVVWNIMVGHLAARARLITYDGGALHPTPGTLLQICEKYQVTYWGTSPRYLLELEQSVHKGIDPRKYNLSHLKMVTTTGATLTGPQMRWFYTVFPPTVHLSSIAGGTEIVSSWISSDPAGPIRENEMQMWALGQDCDVADVDTGESLIYPLHAAADKQIDNRPDLSKVIGELVCRKTFPSQPVGFWNDPNHKKYKETYFERFTTTVQQQQQQPGGVASSSTSPENMHYLDIWTQHDITSFNPVTKGVQITARSDSTLNPSGIRFGPSEIYSILSSPHSTLKDSIGDALCVGRKRQTLQHKDKDETVFLFLVPQKGYRIDDTVIQQVKSEISRGLSARHVPKFIIGLPEGGIPYTVNGKKVEVLVKKIISGEVMVDEMGAVVGGKPGAAGAVSTIVNPSSLALYGKFVDMERENTKPRARL